MASAMSAVEPEPFSPSARPLMSEELLWPATPVPLSITAAAQPETWVPWYSSLGASGYGSASLSAKSRPGSAS